MQKTLQTSQKTETIPNVEAKKADIPLGKVGNTEYEVISDGVYYQDKKLDHPENKTHRQLIEADIERMEGSDTQMLPERRKILSILHSMEHSYRKEEREK